MQLRKSAMDDHNQLTINGSTGKSPERSVSRQIRLGLLTNFSSIAPSMSLGFSAVAIPALKSTLNGEQISWFASIASLATPFGCFFSGPIADRFGRKPAIFCINVTCFIGWLVIAVAYYSKDMQYTLLLLGRLLTGFSTGLTSAPATIYMAEVSSSKLRGVFTTWASVSFALGVLVVYMLGYILKDSWGTISLITAAFPCIGLFLAIFLIPESPSWLVGKNRLEEAKKNMCIVFGTKTCTPQVQLEIKTLIESKCIKTYTTEKSLPQQFKSKIKYLLQPHCLKPFGLVLTYFFFQQFSGTFAIVFYAIDIVKNAKITADPYLIIVIIGLVRLVTSVFVSYISKKYGKRPLSILSGTGMTVCMLVLGGYILLIEQAKIPSTTFVPFTLLLLYFFMSTLGFLPLPFALGAEVFPTKIRGTATGLLCGCGYLFNFVTVKMYPNMLASVGAKGIFFFYGGMALLGTIFVIYFLPETKGKSLQEILSYFAAKEEKAIQEEECLKV